MHPGDCLCTCPSFSLGLGKLRKVRKGKLPLLVVHTGICIKMIRWSHTRLLEKYVYNYDRPITRYIYTGKLQYF